MAVVLVGAAADGRLPVSDHPPLVSAGLTLVSTLAACGAIVAVFQRGWLGTGIDNGATAPVDPWISLMLFALLFGLSVDYQVFLLSPDQ